MKNVWEMLLSFYLKSTSVFIYCRNPFSGAMLTIFIGLCKTVSNWQSIIILKQGMSWNCFSFLFFFWNFSHHMIFIPCLTKCIHFLQICVYIFSKNQLWKSEINCNFATNSSDIFCCGDSFNYKINISFQHFFFPFPFSTAQNSA